jgi:hypothetical protein
MTLGHCWRCGADGTLMDHFGQWLCERCRTPVAAGVPTPRCRPPHVRACVPEAAFETSEADGGVELLATIRADVEAMIARRGWVLTQALTGPRRHQVTRQNGSLLFEASTFRDLRVWLSKQPVAKVEPPRTECRLRADEKRSGWPFELGPVS